MSPEAGIEVAARFCFPRVSGDEPLISTKAATALKFSPRERG